MKVRQKFKYVHQANDFKQQDRKNSENRNIYPHDVDEIYHPRSLAQRPEEAVGREEEDDMT